MCDHCRFPELPGETRRSFLRKVTGAVAAAGLMGVARAGAADLPQVAPAGWARLITPNADWNFHRDRGQQLASFIERDTDLKFNSEIRYVSPDSLGALCAFPFLFSFDLTAIRRSEAWANLREYLYRGGFLYLDACVHISPDLVRFEQDHLARLTQLLPGSEVRRLSPKHPIFRARYPVSLSQLPGDPTDPSGEARALYGIFDDDRMVALLSMAHLFCGWPEHPEMVETCMKQIANIYAYSRAH